MKTIIAIALTAGLFSQVATARERNPLETVEQARQRQSSENYQTYERRENRALPPVYQQPLGSPSVYGVDRPGYTLPRESWRDRD